MDTLVEAQTRFWKFVDKSGDCWIWKGATVTGGYGAFTINYKHLRAHRISWTLENGEVPHGKFVWHICGTRLCVRPDHMFLGTHKERSARIYGEQAVLRYKKPRSLTHTPLEQ